MAQSGDPDNFDLQRAIINYSARFTLHELLLEIILAVEFGYRTDPLSDFADFRSQIVDDMRFNSTLSDDFADAPQELPLLIQEETVRLAEQFFHKTEERIKAVLAQLQERGSDLGGVPEE